MRGKWALAIVALAIALAASCARKPDDGVVVTKIKSQMFSDAQLKESSLQVTSKAGVVTLSGSVATDAARLDAYKIAATTPGVSKVIDQMTVEGQAGAADSATASTATPAATEPAATARAKEPERKTAEARTREKEAKERRQEAEAKPETGDKEAAAPEPAPPVQSPEVTAPAGGATSTASTAPAPGAPATTATTPTPPPAPEPQQVVVPANSTLTVQMIDSVDSSVNHAGEIFHATLDEPIVVENQVVVPKGADVYVRLTSVSSAGKMRGKSGLTLELVKLEFQGQSYPLVSSTYTVSGKSQGKETAKKVGAGAVIGTLIGAIAGRGEGAAIGAGVGAAAGGVYQGMSKKQVKVPSETKLDFQLDQPVTVTVMPHTATAERASPSDQ
jgi:hypothetical protein